MQKFFASLKSAVGTVQGKQDPTIAQVKPANVNTATGSEAQQPDAVLLQLLRNVRNKHVRQQFLEIPKVEYTETKKVCIVAGTYNLNGKKPPPDIDLADWFNTLKDDWPPGHSGPDIVAVGFQEIIPLSAGNVLAGGNSEDVEAWDQLLAAALNGQEWATRQFRKSNSMASLSRASTGSNLSHSQATPQSMVGAGYQLITEQASGLIDGVNKMWSGGPRGTATADLLHFLSMESGELAAADIREDGDCSNPEARKDDFIQLAAKQLVGVYLSVWVRKSLLRHISGVQTTSVATGFGGLLGNKGAVAMRMRLYDSPLCFVSAHFQSGDGDGDEVKRNADFADIVRRAVFPSEADLSAKSATDALSLLSVALGPGQWGEKRGILDHENIVWVGDLNYRLDMADEEVRKLLRSNRISQLLEADQLLRELNAGRVFFGWKEGQIKFLPTFKYRVGTNNFVGDPLPSTASIAALQAEQDAESDAELPTTPQPEGAPPNPDHGQKRRTPAWCDRVLWLTSGELQQLAYRRGELTASDHRPVAASFSMSARHYKRDVVEALIENTRRKVDMSEMARRPKCMLEPNMAALGEVSMYQWRTFSVTLFNTGTVDAFFHFVALPSPGKTQHRGSNLPLAPRWLTVAPEEGQVAAGENAQITLTVEVRGGPDGSADQLAQQPNCAMDAILILRVEDAMDHFISVTGQFQPSTFGLALSTLATYGDRPVRPKTSKAAGNAPGSLERDSSTTPGDSTVDALLAFAASANSPPTTGEKILDRKGSMAQGAQGETTGSIALPSSSASEALVPKEVRALAEYLMAEERLGTPGLFVASTEIAVRLAAGQQAQAPTIECTFDRVLDATEWVRGRLDEGEGVLEGTSPHVVAATLLLLFQELPSPFMPAAAAEAAVCGEPVPPAAALDLLSRHMPPVDFAVLHHMLHMARCALQPEVSERNGLGITSLAALLADHWFLPLPPGVSKLAEASTVTAGRIAFVLTLLEGLPDPSQVLQLPIFDSVDAAQAMQLGSAGSSELL